MLRFINNPSRKNAIISVQVLLIFWQALYPTVSYALTGGPSQPEVQSFEPVGTSQMVDLSTGDFVYNIPLLDVGGYPINLSYHSGITTDQEASWVGLGWNINPGVINRNMRGLPDDFKGETIRKTFNVKDNKTLGVKVAGGLELIGLPIDASLGMGINYNNYRGYGVERNLDIGISLSLPNMESATSRLGLSLNAGSDGLQIEPNLSFSSRIRAGNNMYFTGGARLGFPITSSQGLKSFDFGFNVNAQSTKTQAIRTMYQFSATGSVLTFTPNTHVPVMDFPRKNNNYTFSGKVGGVYGAFASIDMSGYLTINKIDYEGCDGKTFETEAYGYLYENHAGKKDMLDFNREKDVPYMPSLGNLPLTNHTFDMYAATGQGMGGMFRAKQNYMNYVHDPHTESSGFGSYFGLEAGVGTGFHAGADVVINTSESHVGPWQEDNNTLSYMRDQEGLDEPVYFETVGEKTAINQKLYNSLGAEEPVMVDMQNGTLEPTLVGADDFQSIEGSLTSKEGSPRKPRSTLFSYLTVKELEALKGDYVDVPYPDKEDHIGEITVTKPTGERYVYGQAAYNTAQSDLVFAVGDVDVDEENNEDVPRGILSFEGDELNQLLEELATNDDPNAHIKGRDNYYSSTEVPAYAHSYLLTEVLSVDYVDLTGDGPTEDDLGSYTQFKYNRECEAYKWRVPYEPNTASHNPGLLFDEQDDKGVVLEGEKDIYYLSEVLTRTHQAEFIYSDRNDGAESTSNLNAESTNYLKKLDKIVLSSNGELIKTVHFKYDYELCQGIPNNNGISTEADVNQGGKLTLKKLYFTHGQSKKGRLNSYDFDYYADDFNPDYKPKAYDRWGNYAPYEVDGASGLTSIEYPYVSQEKDENDNYLADQYAKSWNLSKITLPSGGEIDIELEADDYAYVQDEKAMEMFKIEGSSNGIISSTAELTNKLQENDNHFMWFKLKDQDVGLTAEEVQEKYFGSMHAGDQKMYFKYLVQLSQDQDGPEEYISGYADVEQVGVKSLDGDNYAYVKLAKAQYKGATYNPVSFAAWNFIRLQASNFAVSSAEDLELPSAGDSGIGQLLTALFDNGLVTQLVNFIRGPYKTLKNKKSARTFTQNKSWVRLLSPDGKKKGGGLRVASLSVNDDWDHSYKTNYSYTMPDGSSSGVASYEPILGGEENALKQPMFYHHDNVLIPDDEYLMEKPMGESFYPTPSVAYRNVRVATDYTDADNANINVHKTGHTEYSYYTAKEFPVFVRDTEINNSGTFMSGLLGRILKLNFKNYTYASQGYSIELNDMHGKMRSMKTFDANAVMLSSTEYNYQTKQPFNPMVSNQLNNEVFVDRKYWIDEKGIGNISTTPKFIGIECDWVVDYRESYNKNQTIGVAVNGGAIGIPPFMIPYTVPLPKYSKKRETFNSAVFTKVITKYGILKEVTSKDLGVLSKQVNKIWDNKSGEVLCTSVNNGFDSTLYKMSFPAYRSHLYTGMGMAYENTGRSLSSSQVSDDGLILSDAEHFEPGDELLISYSDSEFDRAWIKEGYANELQLIDRAGNLITEDFNSAKVIRSGKRNQLFELQHNLLTPDNQNQIVDSDIHIGADFGPAIVLDSDTYEYTDDWAVNCNCTEASSNPYVSGQKGNWRLKKHFKTKQDRSWNDDSELSKTDISAQGVYSLSNTYLMNEITHYSPYGQELENKDAAGNYTSAKFGYDNTLPTALVNNAQYNNHWHLDFEEDLGCAEENAMTIGLGNADATIENSQEQSHTGRQSIKVSPGSFVGFQFEIEE